MTYQLQVTLPNGEIRTDYRCFPSYSATLEFAKYWNASGYKAIKIADKHGNSLAWTQQKLQAEILGSLTRLPEFHEGNEREWHRIIINAYQTFLVSILVLGRRLDRWERNCIKYGIAHLQKAVDTSAVHQLNAANELEEALTPQDRRAVEWRSEPTPASDEDRAFLRRALAIAQIYGFLEPKTA